MVIVGTGHRPDRLGGWDNHELSLQLPRRIARDVLKASRAHTVISGMAAGWDLALASAAIDLGIELVTVIPHEGQGNWSDPFWRMVYTEVRRRAREEYVLYPRYTQGCLMERNEKMLEIGGHGATVLALWGGGKGGTAHCVGLAQRRGMEVVNLWPRYNSLANQGVSL